MKPLVLHSHAVFIATHRFKLTIKDYINRTELEIPPHEMPYDLVVVLNAGGNVSFEAVRWLSEHNVAIAHLNWDGNLIAVTLPPGPIAGKLRVAQYQAYLDVQRRLQIARAFVAEKVSKSLALLRYLKRYYPEISTDSIEKKIAANPGNPSGRIRASVMTMEGSIADDYWDEYAKVIGRIAPDFRFVGRKQSSIAGHNSGAADPANSALNYLYGVIEAYVRVAIQQSGLDPNLGFLHEAQPGATPLVYDVMECFRWVADLTLIEMIQQKQLKRESFTMKPDYRLWLKPEAASLLTKRLSENFNRKAKVGGSSYQLNVLMNEQVRRLVRFLDGSSKSLDFKVPFVVDDNWADEELRERILNMSVEERKRIGLRKNTLFYMKKNAEAGKPMRVYGKVQDKVQSLDNRYRGGTSV